MGFEEGGFWFVESLFGGGCVGVGCVVLVGFVFFVLKFFLFEGFVWVGVWGFGFCVGVVVFCLFFFELWGGSCSGFGSCLLVFVY